MDDDPLSIQNNNSSTPLPARLLSSPQRKAKTNGNNNISTSSASSQRTANNTSKRPQPVRWLANAANPFLGGGGDRKEKHAATLQSSGRETLTSKAGINSSNIKINDDNISDTEIASDHIEVEKYNEDPAKKTKKGSGSDDDDDGDDDVSSDDESLVSTLREMCEKAGNEPDTGKSYPDPPAAGDEIWLNAGIALTSTSTTFETSSSRDYDDDGQGDDDDLLLFNDDDPDDESRNHHKNTGSRESKKVDAPPSPFRQENVSKSAVSDLMWMDRVKSSASEGGEGPDGDGIKEESGDSDQSVASSSNGHGEFEKRHGRGLPFNLFGRFTSDAGRGASDDDSDNFTDARDGDGQKDVRSIKAFNIGRGHGDDNRNGDDMRSVDRPAPMALPVEILTLSPRSPSTRNRGISPRSTSIALENAQDMASNLARDLEAVREENERLVASNRRLLASLQGVKQHQEDNMIYRGRLIKACLYCSPVFILCGGLDAFLSTGTSFHRDS